MEKEAKAHTGKCCDCSGPLELYEMDLSKATKIMLCSNCGLYHFFKKDFIGTYKLIKVSKNPIRT